MRPGLCLMKGRMSLNIITPLDLSKGSVTQELIKRFGLKSAVYSGEDVTDIDALGALTKTSQRPGFTGFAVAVTSHEAPLELAKEADFTLSGITGVEQFLSWLQRQAVPTTL